MLKQYLTLTVLITCGAYNYSNAQEPIHTAKEYLRYEDYNRALQEYLKLYNKDKNDLNSNLMVGFCYLNINDDKSKAIPYLEFVYKKGGYDDELLLYLGMAYMYAYKFDDAIKFFNDYRKKLSTKKYDKVDLYINNCENAKVLMKNPVNVTFENLGKKVNSPYPDYSPFVTKDHSTLYFTSSRETNARKIESSQGFYTSDIYYSKVKDGEWSKPKSLSNIINTAEDEQCVYVTPDGKNMIINIDNETVFGNLFLLGLNDNLKSLSAPVAFNYPVNTSSLELEGCITEDGNMMIVSSNRLGGLGETDLYMFKKLPNGEWGLATNLGPNINTKFKEAYPVYDEENKILYFSSQGHTNIGGFDIFKSEFDPLTQTFKQAENIGYPINTPEDNMQFSLAGNKRDGYTSAYRKEGFGDLDLYKVVFNDVETRPSIIKGIISKAISDTLVKEIDAVVAIYDVKTNKELDSKKVNPISGKYIFAVEPGKKYLLTVKSPEYEDYKKEITVYDKSDYLFEIDNNILLQKPEDHPLEGKANVLKPVNTSVNKKTP